MLLKDYAPQDNNADETGLFCRVLANETRAIKNEKCVRGKCPKNE